MNTPSSADPPSRLTKQEQLRRYILAKLETGELKPGDELPTERALAEQIGVARGTVARSLASLERHGLIRRVQGRGTFVHQFALNRIDRVSGTFAIIVPQARFAIYQSLFAAFEHAAWVSNNQVVLVSTDDDPGRQSDAVLQLLDRGIAGMAAVPSTIGEAQAYQFGAVCRAGVPLVFCNRAVPGVPAPALLIDAEMVGRTAARELVERGHRNIAVHSSHRYRLYEDLTDAFVDEAGKRLGEGHRIDVRFGDRSSANPTEREVLDKHERWLAGLLDRPNPITAIFSTFDPVTEHLYYLLTRLGVRVPEDVSVLSLGGAERSFGLGSVLSAVTIDAAWEGRRAFELLERQAHEACAPEEAVDEDVPLGFSEGRTLGPAK
jgi:GntR family transcriptional regulator of arabinose operon